MDDEQDRSEQSSCGLEPYEHPALEPEAGYWAGRWVEFKRLFIKMAWENDHSRTVLIFSAVVFIATFFGVRFLGWG